MQYRYLKWVLLYGAMHLLLGFAGNNEYLLCAADTIFSIVILTAICRNEGLEFYHLNIAGFDYRAIFLLLVPASNWIISGQVQLQVLVIIGAVTVAFLEELLFRAVLPGELIKHFNFKEDHAIVASSILFALLHIANFASGGQSVAITVLQVVFAFFSGMAFSVLLKQTGTIVWGIVIHALINISAQTPSTDCVVQLALAQTVIMSVYTLSYMKGRKIN